jgi:hypothetical protein
VPRGQRDESLQPYSRISRPEPLLFLSSNSSIELTRMSGPSSIFLHSYKWSSQTIVYILGPANFQSTECYGSSSRKLMLPISEAS